MEYLHEVRGASYKRSQHHKNMEVESALGSIGIEHDERNKKISVGILIYIMFIITIVTIYSLIIALRLTHTSGS